MFDRLSNPSPEQVGATLTAFLQQLSGPTIIHLEGRDKSRCRVVVTLLHGNEPSGLKAIHQLLREGVEPEVSILVAIVSVNAAREDPLFSHRFLPGERDINRLFRPPFTGAQGALAEKLLAIIRSAAPEVVLDIHNTSGNGPDFAVCIRDHRHYLDLAEQFTDRLVITDLRIGALMEVEDLGCPILTLECGGAQQPQSDTVAVRSLSHFFHAPDLFEPVLSEKIDIYHHPVRLELEEGASLCYAEGPQSGVDVTLPATIDHYNFGITWPDTPLAWLGPQGIQTLKLRDASGNNRIDEYFAVREGVLYPRQMLKLFMVTTNPDIAISDCLLYAVKEADHQQEKHE